MINDELTGTLVLVHPEMEHDPAGRQNEIGIIVNSDMANDDIFVGFQDNERALYAPDALLVLLHRDDIHRNLSKMDAHSDWADIKSLTQIDLHLRYGTGDKEFKALEIARDNKNIQPLCLDTLQNQIKLQLSQGPVR